MRSEAGRGAFRRGHVLEPKGRVNYHQQSVAHLMLHLISSLIACKLVKMLPKPRTAVLGTHPSTTWRGAPATRAMTHDDLRRARA
jgi:hypothetical protein